LRIQVKDNGPGLDETFTNQFGKGVGLANTKARLERLYGSQHLLEFANATTGGLIVTLEVPRRHSQPDGAHNKNS
jgi:sensor histidine kinase YesM